MHRQAMMASFEALLSVEVQLQGLCLELVLNLRDEFIRNLALNAQDEHRSIILLALGQSCCLDIDASVAQYRAHDAQRTWTVDVGEEDIAAGRTHIHAAAVDAHNLFHAVDTGECTFEHRGVALSGDNLHANSRVVSLRLILGGDLDGYPTRLCDGHRVNEGHYLAGHAGEQAAHCR